jgi:hypothetical protein
LEALGVARAKWDTKTYAGLQASPARTVAERDLDRGARFVPAIPPAAANTNAETKPLPGRKPDDPTLEAAFRVILRQGTPPEEADAQLARCRDYVRHSRNRPAAPDPGTLYSRHDIGHRPQ